MRWREVDKKLFQSKKSGIEDFGKREGYFLEIQSPRSWKVVMYFQQSAGPTFNCE